MCYENSYNSKDNVSYCCAFNNGQPNPDGLTHCCGEEDACFDNYEEINQCPM